MVTGLHLINNETNIFTDEHYIVPLYQRGYAWEEKHIVQLIDDIMDIPSEGQYYIGSLIVHRRNDSFEVIDGQQRLTTLFLLLKSLGEIQDREQVALRFDCRLLKDRLRKTVLYRIEVPKHTDLNHYFEIMNTRGEQLEQSDILKAKLMAYLQGDKKWQEIFSTIWDDCRSIDG